MQHTRRWATVPIPFFRELVIGAVRILLDIADRGVRSPFHHNTTDVTESPLACPRPMQARHAVVWPDGDGWSYELDFIGRRLLVVKDGARVRVHGFNGGEAHLLLAAIASAQCDRLVLDGVIATVPPALRRARPALNRHRFMYIAFDLLHLDGESLMDRPLRERRAALARLSIAVPVVTTRSFPAPLPDSWARSIGAKGSIAKHADSRYEPGVFSDGWRKLRKPGTDCSESIGSDNELPAPVLLADAVFGSARRPRALAPLPAQTVPK